MTALENLFYKVSKSELLIWRSFFIYETEIVFEMI